MESTQQSVSTNEHTREVATVPNPTFNGLWTEDWQCQGSGYACFSCVAERLYPRQLRNQDFNDPGGDEDEDGRLNEQWISGDDLPGTVAYRITFPEEGGDTVRIAVDEDGWGWPDDQFDLIEALANERFGWLWEYAAAHRLKLQWLDDATYQPRFEDEFVVPGSHCDA